MMPQVPFAENRGGVAALFDQLGDGHLVEVQPVPRVWAKRPGNANAIGIAAGQQGRARRGADRLRHVEIREPPPLARQAVEVRGFESACAIGSDVGVALIVGEDDDNVRQAACRAGRWLRRKHRHCEKDESGKQRRMGGLHNSSPGGSMPCGYGRFGGSSFHLKWLSAWVVESLQMTNLRYEKSSRRATTRTDTDRDRLAMRAIGFPLDSRPCPSRTPVRQNAQLTWIY